MKNSKETLDQILQKIKSKKDIIFFQTLPDIHLKKEMEIPSSFVSVSKSSINLSMSSSALCDCISISEIKNSHGLINKKFTEVFFNLISQRTHPNKFGKNKYSLTVKDLENYIIEGPNLLLKKFNLDKKILNTIENNGFINKKISKKDYEFLVPYFLRKLPFFRNEIGTNYSGNHFLEFQKHKNKNYIMTHLGPGPFSGNLIRLYSSNIKIKFWKKIFINSFKFFFHLTRRPFIIINPRNFKKIFFKSINSEFPANSNFGKDLQKIINIAQNIGYAYQLGVYAHLRDVLEDTNKILNTNHCYLSLIWCVSHNSIYNEEFKRTKSFVYRHNSVKYYKNKPILIAGYNDNNSLLVFNNNNKDILAYDHGIGHLRHEQKKRLKNKSKFSNIYYFQKGTKNIILKKKIFIKSPTIALNIFNEFYNINKKAIIVELEPIATYKNK